MSAILRLVLGGFGGALAAYLACQLYVLMVNGDAATAAFQLDLSHQEYEAKMQEQYGRRFLSLAVAGGLLGAAVAVMAGNRSPGGRRRRGAGGEFNAVLTSEEVDHIFAQCDWADFRGRSPDYAQGLIVGRLADADTGIAAKVNGLDQAAVQDLLMRLSRRKQWIRA